MNSNTYLMSIDKEYIYKLSIVADRSPSRGIRNLERDRRGPQRRYILSHSNAYQMIPGKVIGYQFEYIEGGSILGVGSCIVDVEEALRVARIVDQQPICRHSHAGFHVCCNPRSFLDCSTVPIVLYIF